jgi:hypothetical protein
MMCFSTQCWPLERPCASLVEIFTDGALRARRESQTKMRFHHRANTKANIPVSVSFYRDVLGLAAHQASDFLESLLFFWGKDMAGFVVEIELRVCVAKLVVCLD